MKRDNGDTLKEEKALGGRKKLYRTPSLMIHGNLGKITQGKQGRDKDGLGGAKPHS